MTTAKTANDKPYFEPVINEVKIELDRQIAKWGVQSHDASVYLDRGGKMTIAKIEHDCKNGCKHKSACDVHNEPAYPNGPCSCNYAKTENDALIPSIQECGPGADNCRMGAYIKFHISCRNHADACAAGPYLMDADNTFRRRVLEMLKQAIADEKTAPTSGDTGRMWRTTAYMGVIKAIKDMDDGYWRDCVRRGKEK